MPIISQPVAAANRLAFYLSPRLPDIFPSDDERDYAHYFLNLIRWKYIQWQADRNGFSRLKYDYVTEVIPRDIFHRLRTTLERHKIIDIDRSTKRGKQSYGYRLRRRYHATKRIVCHNPDLIQAVYAAYGAAQADSPKVTQWLASRLEAFRFDVAHAKSIIRMLSPENNNYVFDLTHYRELITEQCKRIHHGDIFWCVDRFGRFHSNLTNLPQKLRAALSLNGEPLIEIDICNSQPLIVAILAANWKPGTKAASRLRGRVFSFGGNPYHRRRPQPVRRDQLSHDVRGFLEECESGTVYESLARPGETKDDVKPKWMKWAYGGNAHWTSRLDRHYPTVANFLRDLKRHHYAHAAHLLQNAEASIVIGGVCEQIRKERPKIVIGTVHDSILCRRADAGYVEGVFRTEFAKLGVHVKLKTEG